MGQTHQEGNPVGSNPTPGQFQGDYGAESNNFAPNPGSTSGGNGSPVLARGPAGPFVEGCIKEPLLCALGGAALASPVGPLVAASLVALTLLKGDEPIDRDKDEDQLFYRRGTSYESTTRLGRQAAAAEQAKIGVLGVTGLHGVSVSRTVPTVPASAATRAAIEGAGFRLVPTPTASDPFHHTLELPKPVTRDVADKFNALFGRTYR
jgi:hypothetical protein